MHLHELAVGDQIYGFRFPARPDAAGGGFVSDGTYNSRFMVKRMTSHPRRFRSARIETEHHRCEFTWIPWVRGKINWCSSTGRDVASGWFSGCLMVRYREGGNWRVAHVTVDADANFDCRTDWTNHQLLPNVDNVSEFSPFTSVGTGASRMGFYTSTGDRYAVGLNGADVMVENPFRDPAEWPRILNGINAEAARLMASQDEISATTVYPRTSSYVVAEIAGPL